MTHTDSLRPAHVLCTGHIEGCTSKLRLGPDKNTNSTHTPARGDAIAVTTFVALWVSQDAVEVRALDTAAATAAAGMVTGVIQLAALCAAPLAGSLCDGAGHARFLIWALGAASVAYFAFGMQKSPSASTALLIGLAVGASEMAVVVSAQALVSRRAPAKARGTVGGLVTVFGSAGILSVGKMGGIAYDRWGPGSSLLVVAAMNLCVCACGLVCVPAACSPVASALAAWWSAMWMGGGRAGLEHQDGDGGDGGARRGRADRVPLRTSDGVAVVAADVRE